MPVFKFMAKLSPEEIVEGEMQAESASALVTHLTESGLFPVEISAVKERHVLGENALRFARRKPARKALILFTRQLANLLEANMTVHSALLILQKQAGVESLHLILKDIISRLQDGQSFSKACAAWPKLFSNFYVNMVRAGEAGSMLGLVLLHLADHLEDEDSVQKEIRAALAYPILMLGMAMITVTLLLAFVVPNIVQMFDEMGQTLPLPTRILMLISNFVSRNWLLLAAVVAGLAGLVKINLAKQNFREKLDELRLKLPFFGTLTIQAEVVQFARTLGALLAHGVPIHKAFDVVVASCKNLALQKEFKASAESIRHGGRIGASLLQAEFLPPLLGQMISTAEQTNQLETVLDRIAVSEKKEVERRVAIFTKLLEPAMIVVLGAVVGFIVFSMMMPIFQMDFVVQ